MSGEDNLPIRKYRYVIYTVAFVSITGYLCEILVSMYPNLMQLSRHQLRFDATFHYLDLCADYFILAIFPLQSCLILGIINYVASQEK